LYIGRTTKGALKISNISVEGPDAKYFKVDTSRANVRGGNGYVRVKVMFRSRNRAWEDGLHAYVQIKNNVNGVRRIRIYGGKNRE